MAAMKKSSTSDRAIKAHFEVLQEFLGNLANMFPECEDTADMLLFTKNCVIGNREKCIEGVEGWCENMAEPLKKGSAKYMKAIESITKKPACIYHAFAYRDVAAIEASSTSQNLRRLSLLSKLNSDKFDADSKNTFWEYMDELNRTAYEGLPPGSRWGPAPIVPTRDDIQRDIISRKTNSSSSTASGGQHSLSSGISDCFKRLCQIRNMTQPTPPSSLATVINEAACRETKDPTTGGNVIVGDMCRNKQMTGFTLLLTHAFPDVLWGTDPPSEEEWDCLNKMIGLSTMKSAIPSNMMDGIENVANKLVEDLAAGKTDISSLNIESIGQQVLAGVSADEMSNFANNIDKIMPALGNLKPF